jgi:hypothetical protein
MANLKIQSDYQKKSRKKCLKTATKRKGTKEQKNIKPQISLITQE